MSYKEENILMGAKKSGIPYTLYPVTKAENVLGLSEYIENNFGLEQNEKEEQSQSQTIPNFHELDDVEIESGSFANSAAGWCSFTFERAFESGTPQVSLQAKAFNGFCTIQEVTSEGFQYCLRDYSGATTSTAYEIDYVAIKNGGERTWQ